MGGAKGFAHVRQLLSPMTAYRFLSRLMPELERFFTIAILMLVPLKNWHSAGSQAYSGLKK